MNLGGLEAGDGRDLLSSSKHCCLCKSVDEYSCVRMATFGKFSESVSLDFTFDFSVTFHLFPRKTVRLKKGKKQKIWIYRAGGEDRERCFRENTQ